MRTARTLISENSGATAVEFALVAPVLFMVILGALEFGRLMWTQTALHFAVEEAARCASVTPATCGTSSQIATYASTVSALTLDASSFTATTPSCGHQVSASYSYQFIAAGFFPFTPTLTAQACVQ
jgi:Flp pilus assembly protein TadG